MSSERRSENLVVKEVTYTLFKDGKFYIIENVPARVNEETGDQYFSPQTVENLHQIILGQKKPVRTIQTPVFNFA
ncbi:MAG: hypothetical protein KDE48_10285 [Anaerolineales bacterium]|nr:hypothetical protein [Anaerolineales bacterium]